MRIWDVCPAYLNRQSLLGEHRELHGLVSILVNNKEGYSKHPETLRWVGFEWAIMQRHQMIAAEMFLRGYQEKTPVQINGNPGKWPTKYIDSPFRQLKILGEKYQHKEGGRLALPANAQQMWRQHKYSILARAPKRYQQLGREVATLKPSDDFSALAGLLSESLKCAPSPGGARNALLHMWGYIAKYSDFDRNRVNNAPLAALLNEIQIQALAINQPYLCDSTALSELAAWF